MKAVLALVALLIAGPALAQSMHCYPLSMMRHSIEEAGGKLIDLTPEQFQFMRGVFVGFPPTSTELPPGDHAVMGVLGNDGGGVLFIDGDQACDAGAISPSMRQIDYRRRRWELHPHRDGELRSGHVEFPP